MMLQLDKPDDFVIATGETHSVREFVEAAFQIIGCKIVWEGSGIEEVGIDSNTRTVRVKINPKYFRPTEVVSNKIILSHQRGQAVQIMEDCEERDYHAIMQTSIQKTTFTLIFYKF